MDDNRPVIYVDELAKAAALRQKIYHLKRHNALLRAEICRLSQLIESFDRTKTASSNIIISRIM